MTIPNQPALQQHQSQSHVHQTKQQQQPDHHVEAALQDVIVQTDHEDDDAVPHSPVVILPSADECFHSVLPSTLGDIRLLST